MKKMNRKIVFPDNVHSTLNIVSAIRERFAINTFTESDKEIRKMIDGGKDYNTNVVLLVLDGLGYNVLMKYREHLPILKEHLIGKYKTVFPATTTAATLSLSTGEYPKTHGHLGWSMYFLELDKNVSIFRNEDMDSNPDSDEKDIITSLDVEYEFLDPKQTTVGEICRLGHLMHSAAANFGILSVCEDTKEDLKELRGKITGFYKKYPTRWKYVHTYYCNPDHIMHNCGINSEETIQELKNINEFLVKLTKDLKNTNTLLIVTADHGHIGTINKIWSKDYPEIAKMFLRMPSFEPRSQNLYIKPEYKDKFKDIFEETFKNGEYILISREQILSETPQIVNFSSTQCPKAFDISTLYGPHGTPEHKRFRSSIGDFIAVATTPLTIFNYERDARRFKSHHAGITPDEMFVPVVTIKF